MFALETNLHLQYIRRSKTFLYLLPSHSISRSDSCGKKTLSLSLSPRRSTGPGLAWPTFCRESPYSLVRTRSALEDLKSNEQASTPFYWATCKFVRVVCMYVQQTFCCRFLILPLINHFHSQNTSTCCTSFNPCAFPTVQLSHGYCLSNLILSI